MKKSVLLVLLLTSIANVFAASDMATDFYNVGLFAKAKPMLLTQTNDAQSCYYLGEIYWNENKKDSSLFYFKKGIEIDPTNMYNVVGEGKCLLLTDEKAAAKQFATATSAKAYKKDAGIYTAVALAYYDSKNETLGESFLSKAKKVNSKSPLPYIAEGDLLLAKKNPSEATARYETAKYFDAKCKPAYVKLARIYENIKIQLAFEYLNSAIAVDSKYAVGYSELALMKYHKGFYPDALTAYETYLSLIGTPDVKDLEQYSTILYFNKKYDETLATLEKIPQSTVFNRIRAYCYYDKEQYNEAFPLLKAFMASTPENEIIWQDYSYYGSLLSKQKLYSEAIPQYKAALKADTTKVGLYKDLAVAYEATKDFPNAIACYKKYLSDENNYNLGSLFNLGRCYYNAASQPLDSVSKANNDSSKFKSFVFEADSVFTLITKELPDNYMGYFWRARVNSLKDPETTLGSAKPYYEKALQIMLAQPQKYKTEVMECYRYLGYYHYVKDEMDESKVMWNKLLEINPNDATAKQAIKGIEDYYKRNKK